MKSYSDNGFKSGQLTNAVIYMIVKDDLSFMTVEKEGFKHLMKTAVLLYKIPSRMTITNMIDDKYEVLSLKVKNMLHTVCAISLTTDVWADTLNTKSYLGLTGHFVDTDNGKLRTIVFGVEPLTEGHNAEYLSDVLLSLTEKWDIPPEKIAAVVTDNGANIIKAVTTLYGKNRHLPCFARTLNLVASKPFESKDNVDTVNKVNKDDKIDTTDKVDNNVTILLNQIKLITKYFNQSVKAADALRNAQKQVQIPLKLIQSVCTRWNSIFYQINRFISLCDVIAPILLNDAKAPTMLTAIQIEELKDLVNILEPLEAVTKEVSGELYLTGSKIIPIVHCLTNSLNNVVTKTNIGAKTKDLILHEIKKRFGLIEHVSLLAISTIFDPRFKKLHFVDKLACSNAVVKINNMLATAHKTQKETVIETIAEKENLERSNIWNFHNQLVQSSFIAQCGLYDDQLTNEFKYYLATPVLDLKNKNPIAYWDIRKDAIRDIAVKYLCIPGTSVPSERVFSIAGNILTEQRNKINPEKLGKLIFLKCLQFED